MRPVVIDVVDVEADAGLESGNRVLLADGAAELRVGAVRDGAAIYERSFSIIREESDLSRFTPEQAEIAVRVVHGRHERGGPLARQRLLAHDSLVRVGRIDVLAVGGKHNDLGLIHFERQLEPGAGGSLLDDVQSVDEAEARPAL